MQQHQAFCRAQEHLNLDSAALKREDSCWFLSWLSPSQRLQSAVQRGVHTRSPAPWPRFPPLATGAQTLAKVKREAWQWWSRLNPQRGFIHIICTRAGRHAQPKYTTVSAYLEVRAGESLRLQSPTAPRGAGATDQDGVTSAELCGRLA